jgi:hypothetical protein
LIPYFPASTVHEVAANLHASWYANREDDESDNLEKQVDRGQVAGFAVVGQSLLKRTSH